MNDAMPVLELGDLRRTFVQGGQRLDVLRGAALTVRAGERVALTGPSGAGKSTLLHIAGLLERADAGSVRIAGQEASALGDAGRTALRRGAIGFVYQFHHLLPEFSARENIMMPQMIAGVARRAAGARADALLDMIGLRPRTTHRPAELSGGEQQRIAIARALANRPRLLIADEPTGNLDPDTAEQVFQALAVLVAQEQLALLMATHNLDLARRMDRWVQLEGGLVQEAASGPGLHALDKKGARG